jgi:hypothetical protein
MCNGEVDLFMMYVCAANGSRATTSQFIGPILEGICEAELLCLN